MSIAVGTATATKFTSSNVALSEALGVFTMGGALISSIACCGVSSTGVAVDDAASYAGSGGTITFFGYGFVPAATTGGAISVTPPASSFSTSGTAFKQGNGGVGGASGTATPDVNGAFYGTATLTATPYASYSPTFAQATGPSNVVSPSFSISQTASGTSPVDFTTATFTATVTGFAAGETVTFTIAGASITGSSANPTSCLVLATGGCSSTVGTVPDLAGGAETLTATGTTSGLVKTATVTYDPNVSSGTTAGAGTSFSLETGSANTLTSIRTAGSYGVHGLVAGQLYNIDWNAFSGTTVLGSFFASATGGVPTGGLQIAIPTDTAGCHNLDIQSVTTVGSTTVQAAAIYANTLGKDVSESTPQNSAGPCGASTYTAMGDLLFGYTGILAAAPSVANIGSPVTLSGTGLGASAQYIVSLGCTVTSPAPCTGAPHTANPTAPSLTTFSSSSAGAVPAATIITLSDTPTVSETGTVEYLSVQTAAHFGTTTQDAYAQFVLAASASLNMTSAPVGHAVVLTAHALNPGGIYDVVFNYVNTGPGTYSGTVASVVAPNALGAATTTFNVPAGSAAGTYPVDLVETVASTGGVAVGFPALDTPPSLTVAPTSGSCTNQGTGCMGIVGTPTTSTSGGNTLISATYTNNSNAPQTAFIYAVVHNALGQTVLYTTSTLNNIAAGGSQTGQLVLFGLAPGTYTATLFVVSTSGTALSTTSTVSVTIA